MDPDSNKMSLPHLHPVDRTRRQRSRKSDGDGGERSRSRRARDSLRPCRCIIVSPFDRGPEILDIVNLRDRVRLPGREERLAAPFPPAHIDPDRPV